MPGTTHPALTPPALPQARCKESIDPDAFFVVPTPANVIACCRSCPDRAACRDWATKHEEHGYWGSTPYERTMLRNGGRR